jgi:hypothetical protein
VWHLEREETQQAAGQTAEDAVENLLDREEQTINDFVETDDEATQGEDQGRKVDQDTS